MKRAILLTGWKPVLLTVSAWTLVSLGLTSVASAGGRIYRRVCPDPTAWHGAYYEAAWGTPVALVVPPTAEYQTNYHWGVGGYRVTPICPQFQFGYPGPGSSNGTRFLPTPPWPSDTDQFGVYYVRGPW